MLGNIQKIPTHLDNQLIDQYLHACYLSLPMLNDILKITSNKGFKMHSIFTHIIKIDKKHVIIY